jgi:hypothetical protein
MPIFIYSLADPRTNQIRYIGKAHNVRRRFNTHMREARSRSPLHSRRWIASLVRDGVEPEIAVIETCDTNETANERERFWIGHFRSIGVDLTNTTDGGDGQSPGYQWPETARKKLSERTKGRKASPQHRANLIAAFNREDVRARRREIARTKNLAANFGSQKGRKMPAEAKAKLAAKWTPERKAAHAEQQRQKPVTAEWRTQLAAALRARWDKHRANKDAGNPRLAVG